MKHLTDALAEAIALGGTSVPSQFRNAATKLRYHPHFASTDQWFRRKAEAAGSACDTNAAAQGLLDASGEVLSSSHERMELLSKIDRLKA